MQLMRLTIVVIDGKVRIIIGKATLLKLMKPSHEI